MEQTQPIETTPQSFASEAEELAYLRQRVSALEKDKINLEKEKSGLLQQLDYWKKRFFGRMSEKRHLPLDPNQLSLFTAEELAQMTTEEKQNLDAEAQKQQEIITRTVTVKKQPKRRSLDTTGLMVVENHLYPEGSTDGAGNLLESYVEIGTETSDRLEMVAPKLYVERTVRHKVILRGEMEKNPEEREIKIAPLPQAPIEHGMAGATVLAEIILGKFLYHLPFYRKINRFREFGLRLPASTIGDWYEKSVESLHVLYKLVRKQVMASDEIFQKFYAAMNPLGVLTTYCAKGAIRRMLNSIGYLYERLPGRPAASAKSSAPPNPHFFQILSANQ